MSKNNVVQGMKGRSLRSFSQTKTYRTATRYLVFTAEKINKNESDQYGSDCERDGYQISNIKNDGKKPEQQITLLRKAYGL